MTDPLTGDSRLGELRSSARGWHGAQLAVLGFIGLCGVLQGQADASGPRWLQVVAGFLVLLALVLECLATALVAGVAWPTSGWRQAGESASQDAADLLEGGRRLRLGIVITFVAVAVLALGAMSSWWPGGDNSAASDPAAVSVSTSGGSVCGTIVEASPGVLAIQTADQKILLDMTSVLTISPVTGCE